MEPDQLALCIYGSAVDADGVCLEHGETACVMTAPAAVPSLIPAQSPPGKSHRRLRVIRKARRAGAGT
jgi:hypothetical protein